MKTNYIGELEILKAVKAGKLQVDEKGRIWRGNVRAENRTPQGYLQARVMVDRIRYVCGAHRIVFMVKVGMIPPGLTINHKNGIKDDNRPENLEVVTYSQNTIHSMRVLGNNQRLLNQDGEKNHAAKITNAQAEAIRQEYAASSNVTQAMLAAKYGIAFQTVSKIVRGDRWKKQGGIVADYTSRRANHK